MKQNYSVIGYYEDNRNPYYGCHQTTTPEEAKDQARENGVIAVAIFKGKITNTLTQPGYENE
jgi:hypothetical protein